jgi:hypothetical protein
VVSDKLKTVLAIFTYHLLLSTVFNIPVFFFNDRAQHFKVKVPHPNGVALIVYSFIDLRTAADKANRLSWQPVAAC